MSSADIENLYCAGFACIVAGAAWLWDKFHPLRKDNDHKSI